ncbi:helix-turn-helix domain-containing protein [Rhodoblastus sp.]|uniref:helix-turn-helix domain-containing protein n=2 Tax=Rhodoblastus sp. TaxID=1962975 RepID=UPI003F99E4A0
MSKSTTTAQQKAGAIERVPLTHTILDVMQELNCGRTKVYAEIRAGALEARKIGRRTIITNEALKRYVASLPTIYQLISEDD